MSTLTISAKRNAPSTNIDNLSKKECNINSGNLDKAEFNHNLATIISTEKAQRRQSTTAVQREQLTTASSETTVDDCQFTDMSRHQPVQRQQSTTASSETSVDNSQLSNNS